MTDYGLNEVHTGTRGRGDILEGSKPLEVINVDGRIILKRNFIK